MTLALQEQPYFIRSNCALTYLEIAAYRADIITVPIKDGVIYLTISVIGWFLLSIFRDLPRSRVESSPMQQTQVHHQQTVVVQITQDIYPEAYDQEPYRFLHIIYQEARVYKPKNQKLGCNFCPNMELELQGCFLHLNSRLITKRQCEPYLKN